MKTQQGIKDLLKNSSIMIVLFILTLICVINVNANDSGISVTAVADDRVPVETIEPKEKPKPAKNKNKINNIDNFLPKTGTDYIVLIDLVMVIIIANLILKEMRGKNYEKRNYK